MYRKEVKGGNMASSPSGQNLKLSQSIVHFTFTCLVAKPLNKSKGNLVMIQTSLFFKCKLLCYHAN